MNRIEETLHVVEEANIVGLFGQLSESLDSFYRIVNSLKESNYQVDANVLRNLATQVNKLNKDIDVALSKANNVLSQSTYDNLYRDFEMCCKQYMVIEKTLKRTNSLSDSIADLLNAYKSTFTKIGNKLKFARSNKTTGNVNGSGRITVGQSIDSKGGMVQVTGQSIGDVKSALARANTYNTKLDKNLADEKENSLV